jgi:type IV pilus assembly protein PilW
MNRVGLHATSRFGQRGFTLIEMMISIVISLLLMTAILQLFLDISRTNDELAKTNAQIENGRFTMQLLQKDFMHAGFWDGYTPPFDDRALLMQIDPPVVTPEACTWPATTLKQDSVLAMPVQSFSAVPIDCTGITSLRANSDLLVVRYADNALADAAGVSASTSTCGDGSAPCIQVSRCMGETPSLVLGTSGFALREKDCATATPTIASKRRFVSNVYHIQDGDVPTLMRSSFEVKAGAITMTTPQALIEGVEGLRIELGIDNRNDRDLPVGQTVDYSAGVPGDGSPDSYVHCGSGCSAEQLANVVTANIYALVRSTQPSAGYTDEKEYSLGGLTLGPFNDNYKRHVFTTNVRLVNVSGRRDAPPTDLIVVGPSQPPAGAGL